jgi:hypothetical protein
MDLKKLKEEICELCFTQMYQKRGRGRELEEYALLRAARGGYLEVLKLLVDQGISPRVQEDHALDLAVAGGHIEVVKFLLSKGSRSDNAMRIAKFWSHTPIVNILNLSDKHAVIF